MTRTGACDTVTFPVRRSVVQTIFTWSGRLLQDAMPACRYNVVTRFGGLRLPAWAGCLMLAAAGAGIFFRLPGALAQSVFLVLCTACVPVVLARGNRRVAPDSRAPWYLLTLAQVLNTVAWGCWYIYPEITGVALDMPSVGDGFFLAGYALDVVALVLLARRAGADRRTYLDVAGMATSVGIVMWVLIADRFAGADDLSLGARVVSSAYPLMDVLVLAMALPVVLGARRTTSGVLLLLWAAAQLCGDLFYNLQVLEGTFALGSPVFGWWFLSWALLAAAGLHRAQPGRGAHAGWVPHAVLAAGMLPLPGLLLLRSIQQSPRDIPLIAAGSAVVTLLAVARALAAPPEVALSAEARRAVRVAVVRFTAALVAFALLPLAGLTYLTISEARSTVNSEVEQRLRTSSDVGSAYVGEHLGGLRSLVASYAERRLVSGPVSGGTPAKAAAVLPHLAALEARNPAFFGAWALSADGTMLAFSPAEPSVIGVNFAYRDYFKGVMRTGRPYVSEAFRAGIPERPLAVAIAAPVRHQGRIVGMLVLGYRLDALQQFTKRLGNAQQATLTLTDQRGTVLNATTAAAGQPEDLIDGRDDRHVRAALAGLSGTARGVQHGTEMYSAYRPVPETGWAVVADVPLEEAMAGANRFTGRVLAVATLIAQVLLGAIVVAARSERRRKSAETAVAGREEQLTGILEAAGDGFICVGADGTVQRWNSRAEDMFGWSCAEAVGSALAQLIVPADQREAHAQGFARVLAGGQSTALGRQIEVQAQRRDGSQFPVEMTLWASHTVDGTTFSAFTRDITDRKRHDAELAAARDTALEASRLKSEFVANMSHEIRTPMNGVIGMTSLLLDTELDDRQRDYLETVSNSANALLAVLNDILDFSKIEAGKLDVEQADFDVRLVVEDVAVLLAASASAKQLEITAAVDPDVPRSLRGDAHRIRQILLNLLGNAVKFTDAGNVTLSVTVASEADGPLAVAFSVTDTGAGIPAERQAQLFSAFTQLDTSATRRHGGTGLGLTISRQLVELMGGRIEVDSEPGRGSTFTFTLPLTGGSSPSEPAVPGDLAGVRALVVDDNETNRRMLTDQLTGWGMRPLDAPDGQAALQALRDAAANGDPFRVALLDMRMPGMTGMDVARAVAGDERLRATRMALLSSTTEPAEIASARAAGVTTYLAKPVRKAQLQATLRNLLGSSGPAPLSGVQPASAQLPAAGHVLVVEDNVVNQRVAVGMLERLGYTADVAGNGAAALDMVAAGSYDVLLMDCHMPVLDGFEATQRLRSSGGPATRVPIIALTASALAEDRRRCLAAGMDDFLPKPISRGALAAALTRVMVGADAAPAAGTAAPQQLPGASAGRAEQEPVLDAATLAELSDLGPEFVGLVLGSFLTNAVASGQALVAAAAAGQLAEVQSIAHSLRGSSGTFGGRRLMSVCEQLESAARERDGQGVAALVPVVERQTQLLCDALRKAFPEVLVPVL
ncbi:MAG: response regulator [Actinomycetota bacterium]|nr:response regulator [Actinomycetota bacterium]